MQQIYRREYTWNAVVLDRAHCVEVQWDGIELVKAPHEGDIYAFRVSLPIFIVGCIHHCTPIEGILRRSTGFM